MGAEFNYESPSTASQLQLCAMEVFCCRDMSTGSSSKSNQGCSASSHSFRRQDALETDFKPFDEERMNGWASRKALVDNLVPNQEELQTYVQVLADKVRELQDDTTPVSGSCGASASSCRQQTSRTRTLATVASLLLILNADLRV